ncbi:MAG: methyltransferase domain-containing protein [Pannonibacter indicus]
MTNSTGAEPAPSHADVRNFDNNQKTDAAFREALHHNNVVLDIGCGLNPFSMFTPGIHLAVEPWGQYHPLLRKRFSNVPGFVLLNFLVPEGLSVLPDKSADSVFMFDVIEHLDKDQGHLLLAEAERIARDQIGIFTPLGFVDQSYEADDKDAWGFDNTLLQTHRSGWTPSDFGPGWQCFVCDTYHSHPGRELSFGAFFALKTLTGRDLQRESAAPRTAGEHL